MRGRCESFIMKIIVSTGKENDRVSFKVICQKYSRPLTNGYETV
jgi:hypothetical protein